MLFLKRNIHTFYDIVTKKCRRRDSSPRPFDYESNALTRLSHSGKLSSVLETLFFCNIYSIQINYTKFLEPITIVHN